MRNLPRSLLASLLLAAACGAPPDKGGPVDVPATDGGAALEAADAGTPAADPVLLTSYAELLDALTTGREVRAVFRYASCTLDGHGPGPDATGGMEITTFEQFAPGVVGNPDAYLSFSESTLVLLGQHYIIDYVKVRVQDDGTVGITVQYLDPVTYAVSVNEKFACFLATAPDSTDGAFFYRR